MVVYFPSLKVGFYADEYQFLERAGHGLGPYTRFFLTELPYFRPVQFVVIGVEYFFFRSLPFGYHLVQVLIHLGNALIVFALMARLGTRWQIGLLASLLYAVLPVYSMAIFWPAVADPLSTLLYLSTIYVWVVYLQTKTEILFLLVCGAFVLALLAKEMNATLFIAFILVDWLLVPSHENKDRRYWLHYLALAFIWCAYLVFEFSYLSSRMHASNPNPASSFVQHAVGEVVPYLLALVAPWGADSSMGLVWLLTCLVLFAFLLWRTRSRALVFLGCQLVLVVLPLLPFLGGRGRYLYMPMIISAVAWGALAFTAARLGPGLGARMVMGLVFASVISASGSWVAESASSFAGMVREHREPVRLARELYPTIPSNTLFYFIDPPTLDEFLSGMFFLEYGSGVTVQSTESNARVGFGDYGSAAVFYRDENANLRIEPVKQDPVSLTPSPPVDFSAPIRLEGCDLASPTANGRDALVLVLYWQAMGPVQRDYTVFVHLIDEHGRMTAGYDSQPRDGKLPTSRWGKGDLVVDPRILQVPADAPPGNYHLEVGLYSLSTGKRLPVQSGERGQASDEVILGPLQLPGE